MLDKYKVALKEIPVPNDLIEKTAQQMQEQIKKQKEKEAHNEEKIQKP